MLFLSPIFGFVFIIFITKRGILNLFVICKLALSRPAGTMYWANQQRFLSAEEVLALQGIFTKDFKAARGKFLTKHRRLCHDLTGNAFSMSVCSAVLSAVMLKIAEA